MDAVDRRFFPQLARIIRWTLGIACAVLIVWAFVDVGARALKRYRVDTSRRIKLTMLHWGSPAEVKIVQTLIDQYMKEHPDVYIERIHASDFQPKLKTMMAGGTPPDLFYLPPDLLPELAQLQLIRPIDDYIRKVPNHQQWLDDFYPVLLDTFRYDVKTERTGIGPLYGIPKDFTTSVFYVNVDLFNRAGVRVPYEGWTWDEFEADMKKIRALDTGHEPRIYGGYLQIWPDSLLNIIWSFGGEYFGPGGFRDVRLDDPPAQRALEMIARVRLQDKTVFNAAGIAKDGGQEFVNGNIGCLGPVGRWQVANYVSNKFHWDVVPVPSLNEKTRASQLYLTAWTMSSQTKYPDECFELMKFLCGPEGSAMQARLGLAIPALKSVANSPAFLSPPGLPKHHADIFLKAIQYIRIQQRPRQAEWNRIVGDEITNSIQLEKYTQMENARRIEALWLRELDAPLRRREWPPIAWSLLLPIIGAALCAGIGLMIWIARREKLGALDRAQQRAGYSFIAPWLFGFLALTLGPMLMSLLLSFSQWNGLTSFVDARSVGFTNFYQLFAYDSTFTKSLVVTGYYTILAVPIGQIAALAVALLMNTKVRGITIFRTIYFVPSVVSGVAMAVLWLQIFNNDYGLLNKLLRPVLGIFGLQPPNWFGDDATWWAIPAFVIMSLWSVGGGMVIYLAGLKGVPASLYEAATIDGAGPLRKLWNVTVPMLSPLIFYNVVMAIIGSFQVFTQAYVMTGAGPGNSTLFYVLNLYRQAFEFHNMGYASAMAWVLFFMVLLLTLLVFRGSRKLVYYEGARQ